MSSPVGYVLHSDNPFEDNPSLIDSLWDLEVGVNGLVMSPCPRFTTRKAYLGRSRLCIGYRKYFHAGLWQNASALVQGRRTLALKSGLSETQAADLEFMNAFPAITNAVPVSFWILSYILADPELANSVRDEIGLQVVMKEINGIKTAEIDPVGLRTQCPLLLSLWEESLRFVVKPTLVRSITTDTKLKDEHLLKTNAVIKIPGEVPHISPIWGSSTMLDPRRFIKKGGKEEREHRKAYVPFSGERNLCPGRHLALNESLAFVAMVLFAFVIENRDGTPFKVIRKEHRSLGLATPKPEGDVQVIIRRREELKGARLGFGGW